MLSAMADSYIIKSTAQPSTSDVFNKILEKNLLKVTSLTFEPGSTINSYDIMIIRNRMPNLTYLDMSEVTIVANNYEYYTGYHSENNILGPYAFCEVTNLETVILPKTIISIGNGAFKSCYSLRSITIHEGVKTIGDETFANCALTSVVFPSSLKRIGWAAFRGCTSLSNLSFRSYRYSKLKEIGGQAFEQCNSLSSIKLPPRLSRIGSYAFDGCYGLQSVNIPSMVKSIEEYAFRNCGNLNSIYPETACPVHINQTTFSTYATANVYVPKYRESKNKYFWNTEWNQFLNLHTYSRRSGTRGDNDEDDDDLISTTICFYLPNETDYEFSDGDIRIEGEPDAELYTGSGLIVVGEEVQKLSEVHFMVNDNASCSIIGNDNISAKKVYLDLTLTPNCWHFMTFPFKVRLSDIICKGNYVFRYYDGETRAQNGVNGWKDLPEGEEFLYPGRGYIFQTDYNFYGTTMYDTDDDAPSSTISIPVETENLDFSGAVKRNIIVAYSSSNPENASWNFMGNPYPSYFDLDETNYEGPITIWNGTGYESIRKGDDVYHFRPLEGFFIQKPENVSEMLFQAAGRHTFSQWAEIQAGKSATRAAETRSAKSRKLINLTISDGSNADKTRVVFNPECAETYEIGTDACKFIAAKAAQIYSVDSKDVNYSINERSEGDVRLGYVAVKSGEMTISAGRMDTPVAIYDKEMGITFDLSKGAYQFSTEAGTFNDRFVLVRDGGVTRIDAVNAEAAADDAPVYTLGGQRVEQMKANRVYITNGKKVIKK